ncbi:MAG TPA: hypothetical protein VG387_12830 [Rhizomicrobium sp.]|jgi:hypothetical protein|nr:hypothetical protein [Rhizomicrobium sp.]
MNDSDEQPIVLNVASPLQCALGSGFVVFLAIAVLGVAVAVASGRRSIVLGIVLIAAMLVVLAVRVRMAWRTRVTLWPERMEIFNGVFTRSVARTDLAGFHIDGYGLIGRLERWVALREGMLDLPAPVRNDPRFQASAKLRDLDAHDPADSRRALEEDPALGATPEDRQAAIATMRTIALTGIGAGLVVGFALGFADERVDPWLPLIAVALVPVAFGLQIWARGAFILGLMRNTARPSLFPLWGFAPSASSSIPSRATASSMCGCC